MIEYLRAFLIGREGWAHFNMLLLISGAFGIFRRDLVKAIGGYRTSAIGEDLDLIVRLHRYLREKKQHYHIGFIPDPVCWTEVPRTLRGPLSTENPVAARDGRDVVGTPGIDPEPESRHRGDVRDAPTPSPDLSTGSECGMCQDVAIRIGSR